MVIRKYSLRKKKIVQLKSAIKSDIYWGLYGKIKTRNS